MQPSKGKKEVGFLLLFGISIAKMRRLLICTRDILDFIKREMYCTIKKISSKLYIVDIYEVMDMNYIFDIIFPQCLYMV